MVPPVNTGAVSGFVKVSGGGVHVLIIAVRDAPSFALRTFESDGHLVGFGGNPNSALSFEGLRLGTKALP